MLFPLFDSNFYWLPRRYLFKIRQIFTFFLIFRKINLRSRVLQELHILFRKIENCETYELNFERSTTSSKEIGLVLIRTEGGQVIWSLDLKTCGSETINFLKSHFRFTSNKKKFEKIEKNR